LEAADVVRAFLLRDGVYTTFEVPGAPFTFLEDINERGQIAGTTYTDNVTLSGARGFLLAQGIDGPLTRIDFPGAPRTEVHGLNNRGQVVGIYENPDAPPDGQPIPMQMPMMKMSGGDG